MATWITAEQAAEITTLNVSGVKRHAALGNLKAKKFGKVWQIDREDLPRFMASRHFTKNNHKR